MKESWLASHCTGEHFGGRAVELAGRVIHSDFQSNGIGTSMLQDFLACNSSTDILTTYTRNPAVLRMIARTAAATYPLSDDDELRLLAQEMPHAVQLGDATYHLNRYGERGLFRGADPAELDIATPPLPLKERFKELSNARHALVVAAQLNKEAL